MEQPKTSAPELPPRPEPPDPRECCESGCDPCVYDLYQDELTRWRQLCEQILAEQEKKTGT